ncbi:MAG TPA: hypothetical protein VFO78_09235 [Candidatus Limnocylindrales bacterium]|nr:hypothetical protein [Candidatus Limnocylindrales bacterium]
MARFLGSARGRLLSVIDTAEALTATREALAAEGIVPEAIEVFSGPEAAAAFDASGGRHGPLARLLRAVQFTLMDQMPDFAYYEAAAREDRFVLSIRPRGEAQMRQAVEVLRRNGGHFINHFGLFTTEEFERWRGEEPRVPGFMRR